MNELEVDHSVDDLISNVSLETCECLLGVC